jgi:hypothetical protein
VVWLDLRAAHRHVVDVTDTSARTNTNVPQIGARLSLPGSLALEGKLGELDVDLRTSTHLLGTPSVQSVHDIYSFVEEDGGRLAHVATYLDDGMATLVEVRRFPDMGAAHSCI